LGIEANRNIHDIIIPAKTVRGIVEGDAVPDIFIPRLIDLHAKGHFPVNRFVKF
jgi:aryl-alcohol dehydrogenase